MILQEKTEQLTEGLLQKYDLFKVPVAVDELAEKLGIKVEESDPDDDNLSGLLSRGETVQVLINSTHSPERKRFSLAHELGHFHLHEGQELFVDGSKVGVLLRTTSPTLKVDNAMEKQANDYAARLLMPAKLVEESLKELVQNGTNGNIIYELSKMFKVSQQAMGFRLLNMGYEFHE